MAFDFNSFEPNWEVVHGVELYDHYGDQSEDHNVAADPYYSTVVEELSGLLRKGWRHAIPKANVK